MTDLLIRDVPQQVLRQIDQSAYVRLGQSPDREIWLNRINRALAVQRLLTDRGQHRVPSCG